MSLLERWFGRRWQRLFEDVPLATRGEITPKLGFALVVLLALVWLIPFLWMVVAALRPPSDGINTMAKLLPSLSPTLDNIRDAWEIGDFPRYTALLNAADEMYVTGDSVSMLSEAVTLGKPTGLIPLEPNPIGRLIRMVEGVRGKSFRIRDLSKFWDDLRGRGLIGSVEEPRRGTLDADPLATARDAVNAAIEGKLPETVVRIRVQGARRPSRAAIG